MMVELKVNPIVSWIKWRIDHNKNCLMLVVGGTGSGKSYASLKLAVEIAKSNNSKFTISGNLDFTFVGLLKKMMMPQNALPGTPFIFEEVGSRSSGASARDWQSSANKLFSSFMQTSRHRRQVLIMNTPDFSFLDVNERKLVHMRLEMKKIDFSRCLSYGRPYVLQVNPATGKIYSKLLRFKHKGKVIKLSKQGFTLPDKEMLAEYEAAKGEFTTNLNRSIIEEHEKKEMKAKEKEMEVENRLIRNEQIVELANQGMTQYQIALQLGCGENTVYRAMKLYRETQKIGSKLPNLSKKEGTGWVITPPRRENTPV